MCTETNFFDVRTNTESNEHVVLIVTKEIRNQEILTESLCRIFSAVPEKKDLWEKTEKPLGRRKNFEKLSEILNAA